MIELIFRENEKNLLTQCHFQVFHYFIGCRLTSYLALTVVLTIVTFKMKQIHRWNVTDNIMDLILLLQKMQHQHKAIVYYFLRNRGSFKICITASNTTHNHDNCPSSRYSYDASFVDERRQRITDLTRFWRDFLILARHVLPGMLTAV